MLFNSQRKTNLRYMIAFYFVEHYKFSLLDHVSLLWISDNGVN